ncbi:Peptidyl-prolyl cis-trans isomerase FKBP62 [Diplonema papillatum]|nr:Peptidyl-prolyl cis-trans isomerase FKBP62 [Diplonema papillatum]KAJ9450937.1 Peptidyl-prolyl cis-trans isomerase FKBP62 [Diplonema papillatum]|eukprot:gene23097-35393_t
MGFIEELDDDVVVVESPSDAPEVENGAAEKAAGATNRRRRLKGMLRVQHWKACRREDEQNRALRARYFEGWWAAAVGGRTARQAARAESLAKEADLLLARRAFGALTSLRAAKVEEAEAHKKTGNTLFAQGQHQEAIDAYTAALEVIPKKAAEGAVYHCNRAACYLKLEDWRAVEQDCTAALALRPDYEKAHSRRLQACEALGGDDLYMAQQDAEALLKLDPRNRTAQAAVARLAPLVEKRKKEQMDEAMQSLKGIGNSVLGYFGMSVDNFKTTQNPDGTYGISFQQ